MVCAFSQTFASDTHIHFSDDEVRHVEPGVTTTVKHLQECWNFCSKVTI